LLEKDALSEAVPLACGLKVIANEALCPAASVRGNEIPLRVNSDVPNVAEDTVTLDPEALSAPLRLLLVPTTTLPKLKLPGETLNCPAVVPEPANAMVKFEFEASETTEMPPLADPAEVGAKATPKVKLCPGDRAIGKLSPVTLNPLPVTLACVTLTLEPPELVKVSDRVALLPICTLPKLRLIEVAATVPGVPPLPESARVRLELAALLTIETLPLADPPVCGAKVTLKFVLWPADSVKGRLGPLRLKPAPVIVAWLIVTVVLLVLVRAAEAVWVAPTCTLPKLRLEGAGTSCPVVIPAPETGRLNDVDTELSVEMELCPFLLWPPGASIEMLPSRETVPLVLPLEDGVKVTVIITLCPGTSVKGRLSPLMLKPFPVTVTWLRVKL
jgi:hypothetical protein